LFSAAVIVKEHVDYSDGSWYTEDPSSSDMLSDVVRGSSETSWEDESRWCMFGWEVEYALAAYSYHGLKVEYLGGFSTMIYQTVGEVRDAPLMTRCLKSGRFLI
jgi:hypothetical protein